MRVTALFMGFTTLLLLSVLAGCGKPVAKEAAPETPVATVTVAVAQRHDVEETVVAQGTLQPAQGGATRLAPQMAGRLVSVLVKEGDQVVAGQTLATLDIRAPAALTRSAEASYKMSAATATQAQLAARASAGDQESSVQVARLAQEAAATERNGSLQAAQTALNLAQTDLARTLAGARPQEVNQAQNTLRQAEATRKRAATEAERQQFLFEKGVSAKRQVEDAQTALTVADASVESAKQTLELMQAGARKEDRDAAQLRVRQAEEALEQARKSGDAKLAQAKAALHQAEQQKLSVAAKAQEVRVAQSGMGKAAADVTAARVQTDYATIRSPITGVVVKRLMNPGDMADTAGAVLEVTDNRQLDLLASLTEEDARRVHPGQRARLGSGDTALVVSVGAVDPQTNLVLVRLRVSQTKELRAGAFSLAKIIVRIARQALIVPKEAVLSREGKSVVLVSVGDIAKETPVTTGVETEAGIEIRSGLAVGAKVVTLGQYELVDGAKIKMEKP